MDEGPGEASTPQEYRGDHPGEAAVAWRKGKEGEKERREGVKEEKREFAGEEKQGNRERRRSPVSLPGASPYPKTHI
jgi:hypothetical protein